MGFKCLIMKYDIPENACRNCTLYCKLNPNCDYIGEFEEKGYT